MKALPLEETCDSILKTWVGFILTAQASQCIEGGSLTKSEATSLFNHRNNLPDCGRKN